MKNLFFNVSATGPATFTIIALLLSVVALIAIYIPAQRAVIDASTSGNFGEGQETVFLTQSFLRPPDMAKHKKGQGGEMARISVSLLLCLLSFCDFCGVARDTSK